MRAGCGKKPIQPYPAHSFCVGKSGRRKLYTDRTSPPPETKVRNRAFGQGHKPSIHGWYPGIYL